LALVVNDSECKAEDGEDGRQEVEVPDLVEDFVVIGLGAELLFLYLPAERQLVVICLSEPNQSRYLLSFEEINLGKARSLNFKCFLCSAWGFTVSSVATAIIMGAIMTNRSMIFIMITRVKVLFFILGIHIVS